MKTAQAGPAQRHSGFILYCTQERCRFTMAARTMRGSPSLHRDLFLTSTPSAAPARWPAAGASSCMPHQALTIP